MSLRYKGAVISATPPTTTGGNSGTAPGAWTLQQQLQAQGAGNWPNQPVWYVEDVFSTWLYTGNGSTQTITNGIDLSTYGGLVWLKGRSLGYNNGLFDTVRGADFLLCSNNTDPSTSVSGIPANAWITGFNSNGFGLGSNGSANSNTQTYASWTFRKQPKFFDVVTYTGNYTARTIAHSLGSVPGCIIVKKTSSADDWRVYHRSLATNQYMTLETTAAVGTSATMWNNTAPTSTVFSIGAEGSVNDPGETFVAYLFAHNAGGFGLTGTDNVISCGSATFSNGTTVNLGYEPQWLLVKLASTTGDWYLVDTMRGWTANDQTNSNWLLANTSAAETIPSSLGIVPTSTGFNITSGSGQTIIYIAIRRGPMKTPTTGTSVFAASYGNNIAAAGTIISSNTLVDMYIQKGFSAGSPGFVQDRLRSAPLYLQTTDTAAEISAADWRLDQNRGVGYATARNLTTRIGWLFSRAPGFFDEVCYTGTGSDRTLTHNLGVAPEMMIVKSRSAAYDWAVYTGYRFGGMNITSTAAQFNDAGWWSNTAPTSSVFTVGNAQATNDSGATYVAYLFASCPGVSKVGSYTGTGTTQTINCGFTGGARFVLIKRTDSTGDWYVWDSTRGIVAGDDPYLLLNTTAAQVTNTDYIDTAATGFEISSTAPAAINANGGTFIYLAIA